MKKGGEIKIIKVISYPKYLGFFLAEGLKEKGIWAGPSASILAIKEKGVKYETEKDL